ncbi:MAG: cytochrome c4 [Proteobacteria bacterium]|nr:cytochrome c4 [Pseudomonadota bacterium]
MKKLLSVSIVMAALCAIGASAQAQDAKAGDAAAGRKKVDMCIGCHGIDDYRASFPEIYRVPKLAGQNAKYIAAALGEYKKGDRRYPTMRAVAASLSDQDIADVAAFYEQQGKAEGASAFSSSAPAPSAAVAELLKKGNCASCHGENFNKPIDPSYPKLAGQHPDYLYAALKAYQTSNNPQIGRNNAIMMGMAKPFTHAELHQLTEYIASLPGDLKTVEQSHFRHDE